MLKRENFHRENFVNYDYAIRSVKIKAKREKENALKYCEHLESIFHEEDWLEYLLEKIERNYEDKKDTEE